MTCGGTQGAAAKSGELDQAVALGLTGILGVLGREVPIVHGRHGSPVVLGDVPAPEDPVTAKRGKSLGDIALECGVAPRAGAIIDADGLVHLDSPVPCGRRVQLDLAHGDADIGMQFAGQVNLRGIRERRAAVRFDELRLGDHGRGRSGWDGKRGRRSERSTPWRRTGAAARKVELGSVAFPFAGMTRIRFDGSSAVAELSAVCHGSPNVGASMPQDWRMPRIQIHRGRGSTADEGTHRRRGEAEPFLGNWIGQADSRLTTGNRLETT